MDSAASELASDGEPKIYREVEFSGNATKDLGQNALDIESCKF